jgi:hypothetical protein
METSSPRLPSVAEKPHFVRGFGTEQIDMARRDSFAGGRQDQPTPPRGRGHNGAAFAVFGTIGGKRAPISPFFGIGYHAGPSPPRTRFGRIAMDEDRFNIALRKFLKVVGITSQREIERVVREGEVEGTELKLRMTLTAENAPLNHIVEETIDLR